jgi:hypothetical protein
LRSNSAAARAFASSASCSACSRARRSSRRARSSAAAFCSAIFDAAINSSLGFFSLSSTATAGLRGVSRSVGWVSMYHAPMAAMIATTANTSAKRRAKPGPSRLFAPPLPPPFGGAGGAMRSEAIMPPVELLAEVPAVRADIFPDTRSPVPTPREAPPVEGGARPDPVP